MTVTFSQIGLQEVELTFKYKVATYDAYKVRDTFSEIGDVMTQRLKDYVGQVGVVHCDICTMEYTNPNAENK